MKASEPAGKRQAEKPRAGPTLDREEQPSPAARGAGLQALGRLAGAPDSLPLTPQDVLSLQRTIGNRGTLQYLQRVVDRTAAKRRAERNARWKKHYWGSSQMPCFPPGTPVKTPGGDRRIEDLAPGDVVCAFDRGAGAVISAQVIATCQNWTQNLVEVRVDGSTIAATRGHMFWVENLGAWLPAVELLAGMTVLLMNRGAAAVESVEVHAVETVTHNLEIPQYHNYFVGPCGVLVHNKSSFEDMKKHPTQIYRIVDRKGRVLYIGKTVQGYQKRLGQHLNSPLHPRWRGKGVRCQVVESGLWTKYETAVHEQHHIDANGGVSKLENRILAITREKYKRYKKFHNPC